MTDKRLDRTSDELDGGLASHETIGLDDAGNARRVRRGVGRPGAMGLAPPGYSVTGVRACDGCRYRGLCQVLRDRRCGSYGSRVLFETPGHKWDATLPNSEEDSLRLPAPVAKEPSTPPAHIR